MAAAYLHSQGAVDLSFGFPRGGLVEGLLIAATGALAGFGVFAVLPPAAGSGRASQKIARWPP